MKTSFTQYTTIGIPSLLKRIKVFKPLNFMPYNKQDAMKKMAEIYGWKPIRRSTESHFIVFEGYWLPTRLGLICAKLICRA